MQEEKDGLGIKESEKKAGTAIPLFLAIYWPGW